MCKLRELRLNQGLRTVDVAAAVGVAESTVRNWEKGRTVPHLQIDGTLKLCRLYQCSLEELVDATICSGKSL